MMKDYLTAGLYAPLASFSGLAVGERRPAERYPTRSMLVGLLGAALGIDRADEPAQQALASGYQFAIQVFAPGRPLNDYHTAQMPSRGKMRFATRREELAVPELNTVLTSRDYRTDFLAGLAVCALPDAPFTLAQLGSALEAPHYTLSFGRKSCPFGLPLSPRVGNHSSLRAALATALPPPEMLLLLGSLRVEPAAIFADAALVPTGEPHMTEFMRDQPISRRRWQFGLRSVAILAADAPRT